MLYKENKLPKTKIKHTNECSKISILFQINNIIVEMRKKKWLKLA